MLLAPLIIFLLLVCFFSVGLEKTHASSMVYEIKVVKYRFLIFFNFKKNLSDRISLNSIILSIKLVVLIVQIFKKIHRRKLKIL